MYKIVKMAGEFNLRSISLNIQFSISGIQNKIYLFTANSKKWEIDKSE